MSAGQARIAFAKQEGGRKGAELESSVALRNNVSKQQEAATAQAETEAGEFLLETLLRGAGETRLGDLS